MNYLPGTAEARWAAVYIVGGIAGDDTRDCGARHIARVDMIAHHHRNIIVMMMAIGRFHSEVYWGLRSGQVKGSN
eukprot:scaffold3514_cov241-Prasinococcus_capsulatus_cf.AAC.2